MRTTEDRKIINALIQSGGNIQKAAGFIHISARIIKRRMESAVFRAEYARAKKAAMAQAVSFLPDDIAGPCLAILHKKGWRGHNAGKADIRIEKNTEKTAKMAPIPPKSDGMISFIQSEENGGISPKF